MAKQTRSVVLGTAGHIDHGKTTLVKALTGTDTDRLPEEKRRGITIELGFAPWPVDDGLQASIVDVPGHENFVRTMVAGAGGIDLVLLVVSAEDGVMPQTREHVNVCRLLGVSRGIVALTKVDRLEGDEEAIELATEDVRSELAGTVFEDAPIIPCSGQTGQGVDQLRRAVKDAIARLPRKEAKGDVIFPLDRVFSVKGHGTVVTGTLQRGSVDLRNDSTLHLVPNGNREPRDVRARAAQVRHDAEDRVVAGSRLALNLGGIDTGDLSRGDVLARGARVLATHAFHAWLEHIPGQSAPWRHDASMQVCVGTAHGIGRIDPLWVDPATLDEASETDGVVLPPGAAGLVRIRLDVPMPIWRDARVIIRAFTDPSEDHRGRTIGGGWVVDPDPSTGRKQRGRWIALGRALVDDDPRTRVLALVDDAGIEGISLQDVVRRSGVDDAAMHLGQLASGKKAALVDLGNGRFVAEERVRPLVERAITLVDKFHADNPMQPGVSRAAVESMLGPRITPDVATLVLDRAVSRGALRRVDDQGTLARPGKGVQAGGELPEHMQRIFDLYEKGGTSPPTLREVQEASGLSPREVLDMVGSLQRTGRLIKVTQDLSYTSEAHEELLAKVRGWLAEHGTIDVQALKGITGLSRKFVVPFLEHLDSLSLTLRKGDLRIAGPRA